MHTFTSEQIRILRLSRHMKQEQVARKMKISKQRYSELENHPRLRPIRVAEILKALGYSVDSAIQFLNAIPPPRKCLNDNDNSVLKIGFDLINDF
jgi:transcriptional regulator with XRE-family HTH domain